MKAEDIPDSIDWHDGLLLTPQHFQQISRRQEALLQYNTAMIAPFYWGIRYLELDKLNASDGLVKIKQVEAVMPDGLLVSYRESDDLRADYGLQIKLAEHQETKRKRMKVYLSVAPQPRQMSQGKHARYDFYEDESAEDEETGEEKVRVRRYDFYEGAPVMDEYTGEGKVRIRRLVPHLRLIVADTPPQGTVNFPLMEVEYTSDGYVRTNFIPPLLSVTSEQNSGMPAQLGEQCQQIATLVRSKAQELAGQAAADSPGKPIRLDLETKSWIRSLAASLPHLEALLSTKTSHPFQIYLALCSMAGHLAALGPQLIPDKPAYEHNDLRKTFQPIVEFIRQAIKEGLTSPFSPYLFTYHDEVYDLLFQPGWMQRRLVLSLRGRPGVSTDELIQWGQECLIGSERHLPSMRQKRILGARRDHIKLYGDLIPPKDVVLFFLHPDAEFIEPGEILQIFNRSAHREAARPIEIVLHVKNVAEVKR